MAEKSTGPLWESKGGWQLHRLPLGAAVISLVIAALLIAPSIGDWFAANQRAQTLTDYAAAVAKTPEAEQKELVDRAIACNQTMTSQAFVLPSFAVPQTNTEGVDGADESSPCPTTDYDAALNLGDGVMARLTVPSAGVDVPVYHSVDAASLGKGVGHVPSTSLPVGGEGTDPVLVGRDGGVFADLGSAQVGDRLTLQIMGQTLAYKITSSEVVEVDQTVPIEASGDEDLITLITAPASDILTQHRLVTAERVEVTDQELSSLEEPIIGGGFPWWLAASLAILDLLGIVIWWSGRPVEEEEESQEGSDSADDDPEAGEDSGVRTVASFAGDPAFQEYLANYQMDPRTEAELWGDEGEDSSYRNVQK